MRLSLDFLRKVEAFLILEISNYLTFYSFSLHQIMAAIYILYSESIDQFYIGSCLDLNARFEQHLNKSFNNAFTLKANDWYLFYTIENLEYETARKIEIHIKKMKSRKYLENLKIYPEIIQKLILKYSAGSSR